METLGMPTSWQGDEQPPPIEELLAHISKNKRKSIVAFLVAFLPLATVSALLPLTFQSAATVAVLPAPEFTVRPDAGSKDQNNAALALDQIMKTETEILASDRLHDAALQTLGIVRVFPDLEEPVRASWPTAWARWLLQPWIGALPSGPDKTRGEALQRFADNLTIRASKDANVINLKFSHSDPRIAAQTLNALLATYARQRARLYDDPQLVAVADEAASARRAADLAATQLSDFKSEHGISHYDTQRDLLLKRLNDAQQTLADAVVAAAEQTAREKTLSRVLRSVPGMIDLYHENDPDERLQALDEGLTELQGRLAAARVHYLETSRVVSDLRHQILVREAERKSRASDGSPSVRRSGRPPSLDQLVLDDARASADRAAAQQRSHVLLTIVAELSSDLARLQNGEHMLDSLQREKDRRDEALRTADRVLAERRLTEAEDKLRLANVRIIQPAQVPLHPTWLKRLVLVGGVLGGVAAAFASLCWEFLGRPTFLTAAGLSAATTLPVLGVLTPESWEA